MAHNATPSQATETDSHYARWTQAHTGKEPTMKLMQEGHMPMTQKRHGPKKKVK